MLACELTEAEAALFRAFRAADDRAKAMITIAADVADVAVKSVEERSAMERCEVIGSSRHVGREAKEKYGIVDDSN